METGAEMRVSVSVPARPVRAGGVTDRVLAVAALFGLKLDEGERQAVVRDVAVRAELGEVVLITGESGAGKSTLLRAVEARLRKERPGWEVVRLESIELAEDRAVVDCFACGLEEALGHLARAGLSDARVLLRTPGELSEGQKFRYRLARFFASEARVLVADEFAAGLDRVTAKVVAWQLGKFVRGSRVSGLPRLAMVATSQEDLGEDLAADVRVAMGVM